MFRRLVMRLFGVRSPSESARWAAIGTSMIKGMQCGMEQSAARRAELLASGLTPEEAQAVLLRELVLNADPAMLAHAELVAKRLFGTLYEDEGEDA
jgi:hypothetical protein